MTLASFLAYFVMSGMLAPIGIILQPMAEHFDRPVTEISALFSWLTFGILAGSITALLVFDWFSLKRIMLALYLTIAASLLLLGMADDLLLVRAALGLVGLCCGIGLAAAASIIASEYAAERRASMLVVTDASFSVAGIVCSWVAIFLVAREVQWSGTYQLVAGIACMVVLLSVWSTFPAAPKRPPAGDRTAAPFEHWPAAVWLCIAALFLYTMAQYSMLWWLPNHLETALDIPRQRAGEVVGQFWSGMLVAQLFVAWWVLKVGVPRLVLIGATATFLCSLPLWLHTQINGLILFAFVWGFANLGLLKIIISFGTMMVRTPTPRLVSGLLLGATLGTSVSPWLSSRIVEWGSPLAVLQFSSFCYLLLIGLLIAAGRTGTLQHAETEALPGRAPEGPIAREG
ncbi:MAG: MFS transporter TsgA [Gammaproteobacteria bacterium]|nr:MFS transporter TsgA [Gammaproteobacteria bacterium]